MEPSKTHTICLGFCYNKAMLNNIDLYITYFLQISIALTLINVWLVHFSKPTKYRGKGAENMLNEFKAYGLPVWFMYLVGVSKLTVAACFITGIWFPVLVLPAAILLAMLMVGAVVMHMKVKDSLRRTTPAIGLLLITLVLIVLILS